MCWGQPAASWLALLIFVNAIGNVLSRGIAKLTELGPADVTVNGSTFTAFKAQAPDEAADMLDEGYKPNTTFTLHVTDEALGSIIIAQRATVTIDEVDYFVLSITNGSGWKRFRIRQRT